MTLDYKAPVAAGIMNSDDRRHGIRLYPYPSGRCRIDSRHTDGTDRMLPECGRCLQDNQLGKYRPDSRHAADVAGIGENRSIIAYFRKTCRRTGQLRWLITDGRDLFHDFVADDVYQ